MQKTGFLLVDGNESLKRAAAVPRHWLAAVAMLIVAQWIYTQGHRLSVFLGSWLSGGDTDGFLGSSPGALAFTYAVAGLIYRLLPSLVVAALALHFSKRVDQRTAKAVGVDIATVYTAFVWVFAGLVVALPAIVAILTSGSAKVGLVPQGAAVLTPITVVQAGAEEILFRGVILASLAARYGVRTGLLVSALLFGLWHVYIGQPLLDAGVAFFTSVIFGLTMGVLALHYANLGPSLALHVIWNVAAYLHGAVTSWDEDFWAAWINALHEPWSYAEFQDGSVARFVLVPLMLQALIVYAVCRETVARLLRPRAPAIASQQAG